MKIFIYQFTTRRSTQKDYIFIEIRNAKAILDKKSNNKTTLQKHHKIMNMWLKTSTKEPKRSL